MTYTKEPWKEWKVNGTNKFIIDIDLSRNTRISCPDREHAERIVVCINKCAGLSNSALEADVIYKLIDLYDEVCHGLHDADFATDYTDDLQGMVNELRDIFMKMFQEWEEDV